MDNLIDSIFEKNENTTVRSTALTCKNYTLFSCPKEILDIFQRAANSMIVGGTLPQTFITPSLVSDINLKSRITATKVSFLVGFIYFASVIFSFPFLYSKNSHVVFSGFLIFSFVYLLLASYIGGYAYWYGRITGTKVDEHLSKKINDNSSRVFLRTSIFIFF